MINLQNPVFPDLNNYCNYTWCNTGLYGFLCRALPKDTEISDWSVCDFIKSLQDNRYLHGLPVFFGTKLF